MDTRRFRITLLTAALLAAAHAGECATGAPPDALARARQGLRWVTQRVQVTAPPEQPPQMVITTGVRG